MQFLLRQNYLLLFSSFCQCKDMVRFYKSAYIRRKYFSDCTADVAFLCINKVVE